MLDGDTGRGSTPVTARTARDVGFASSRPHLAFGRSSRPLMFCSVMCVCGIALIMIRVA